MVGFAQLLESPRQFLKTLRNIILSGVKVRGKSLKKTLKSLLLKLTLLGI